MDKDKKVRIIEVKESVFSDNRKEADELRKELKEKKCFLINVMSSPGSGKTTLLINLINKLKEKFNIGVLEADIDSDVDCDKVIKETGVKAIQIHTGGACHLTADMVNESLNEFGIDGLNLLFLENVGNLVCPAEFDTGSHLNMCILSVPEGDDKPLKYPLMFEVSDLVVFSKIDTLPVFDFSIDKAKENVHLRNKNAKIFPLSCKAGKGVDELVSYLEELINKNIK